RAGGQALEEPCLHGGEVVGQDRPAAVHVVERTVVVGPGHRALGGLEEPRLHLGEVIGQHRGALVHVALDDVEDGRRIGAACPATGDLHADLVAVAGGRAAATKDLVQVQHVR